MMSFRLSGAAAVAESSGEADRREQVSRGEEHRQGPDRHRHRREEEEPRHTGVALIAQSRNQGLHVWEPHCPARIAFKVAAFFF